MLKEGVIITLTIGNSPCLGFAFAGPLGLHLLCHHLAPGFRDGLQHIGLFASRRHFRLGDALATHRAFGAEGISVSGFGHRRELAHRGDLRVRGLEFGRRKGTRRDERP